MKTLITVERNKYTDADQEKIAKSVLSKISYVIVSSSVTGKNAVVKLK